MFAGPDTETYKALKMKHKNLKPSFCALFPILGNHITLATLHPQMDEWNTFFTPSEIIIEKMLQTTLTCIY